MTEPVVVLRYNTVDNYEVVGYMLTRIGEKYSLTSIEHCSCYSTEYEDEESHTLSLEEVIQLAKNKSDPRVPDTKTEDDSLLGLYELILTHQEDLKDANFVGPLVSEEYYKNGEFSFKLPTIKITRKNYKKWESEIRSAIKRKIKNITNLNVDYNFELEEFFIDYWLPKNSENLDDFENKAIETIEAI